MQRDSKWHVHIDHNICTCFPFFHSNDRKKKKKKRKVSNRIPLNIDNSKSLFKVELITVNRANLAFEPRIN